MSLIDDIKRDRKAGTAGDWRHSPWHVEEGPDGVYSAEDWLLCTVSNGSDARRIARVPELEQAYLDLREKADALADAISKYAILEEEAADAGDSGNMDAAEVLYASAFDEWAKMEAALVAYREATS